MDLDRPIVLATRNQGKIKEFRGLLSGYDIELKSLNDFGPIPQVREDGESFEENAVKKARFAARVLGFPALADDSGLVVKTLGGKPGVYSARFAGNGATDEENNRKLLNSLQGVKERDAEFVCVLALAVPRGPALVYEGKCAGWIADRPAGDQGFGYDPLFYYPPLGMTFAQMSSGEKNRVSHRGRAMAEFQREFDNVLTWLKQRLREEPY